ncbi:hypothetical protein [Actinomadura sp. CNU-125]|uniref:hypothetical protein n=1 Tax=Actinomadura sp. CNU-125 TaxID=1904961 RepID=UPI003966F2F7
MFVPKVPVEAAYAHGGVVTHPGTDGRPRSMASDPSVVAQMLEQLDVQPGDRVLEVGAGAWEVPPAWTGQLAHGGRIVVPLRVRGLTRSAVLERRDGFLESRRPASARRSPSSHPARAFSPSASTPPASTRDPTSPTSRCKTPRPSAGHPSG